MLLCRVGQSQSSALALLHCCDLKTGLSRCTEIWRLTFGPLSVYDSVPQDLAAGRFRAGLRDRLSAARLLRNDVGPE